MIRNRVILAGLAIVGGFALVVSLPSDAARNSGGTYSLPSSVNPVTSGNTITANWANSTLNDLATEMTDSLSRSGKGAMTAQLQLASGTVGTPGLGFSADPDTGLYRTAANEFAASVGGSQAQRWGSAASTFTVPVVASSTLAVTGASTLTGAITGAAGATLTQSQTNTEALTATGNGTGPGARFTGGATGNGMVATGGGTLAGAVFVGGTTATGGVRRDAATLSNGDLDLSNVANVTSTAAVSERLTPSNIPKAWASVSITNATPFVPSVSDGFNIASVARQDANTLRVTFATPFASANYAAVVTANTSGPRIIAKTTTTVDIGIGGSMDSFGAVLDIMLVVYGNQ